MARNCQASNFKSFPSPLGKERAAKAEGTLDCEQANWRPQLERGGLAPASIILSIVLGDRQPSQLLDERFEWALIVLTPAAMRGADLGCLSPGERLYTYATNRLCAQVSPSV
jgi:hypothetical protein